MLPGVEVFGFRRTTEILQITKSVVVVTLEDAPGVAGQASYPAMPIHQEVFSGGTTALLSSTLHIYKKIS